MLNDHPQLTGCHSSFSTGDRAAAWSKVNVKGQNTEARKTHVGDETSSKGNQITLTLCYIFGYFKVIPTGADERPWSPNLSDEVVRMSQRNFDSVCRAINARLYKVNI